MTDKESAGAVSALELLAERVGRPGATDAEVREIGGSLGHILYGRPRDHTVHDAVRKVRTTAAASRRTAGSFRDGYVQALVDLLGAYERTLGDEIELAELEANAATKVGRRLLIALGSRPMTPTELAVALAMDQGQVSRELGKLQSKGLVVTVLSADARARPRELTSLGHLLAARLEGEDESVEDVDAHMANIVEASLRLVSAVQAYGRLARSELVGLIRDLALDHSKVVELWFTKGVAHGLAHARPDGMCQADGDGAFQRFFEACDRDPETFPRAFQTLKFDLKNVVLCTSGARLHTWNRLSQEHRAFSVYTPNGMPDSMHPEAVLIDDMMLRGSERLSGLGPMFAVEPCDEMVVVNPVN